MIQVSQHSMNVEEYKQKLREFMDDEQSINFIANFLSLSNKVKFDNELKFDERELVISTKMADVLVLFESEICLICETVMDEKAIEAQDQFLDIHYRVEHSEHDIIDQISDQIQYLQMKVEKK